MTFSQTALEYVHPGSKVLDLGAGNGWFTKECVAQQALVTAVDVQLPTENHPDVDWYTMKVQDFIDRFAGGEQFDMIFSRNLIQFLDADWVKEKLFPALLQHIAPHGVIAVQTFYQDPEPPFDSKVSSLYTVDDLQAMLPKMTTLHQRQFSETSPDMNGVSRKFFVTNVIVQKHAI